MKLLSLYVYLLTGFLLLTCKSKKESQINLATTDFMEKYHGLIPIANELSCNCIKYESFEKMKYENPVNEYPEVLFQYLREDTIKFFRHSHLKNDSLSINNTSVDLSTLRIFPKYIDFESSQAYKLNLDQKTYLVVFAHLLNPSGKEANKAYVLLFDNSSHQLYEFFSIKGGVECFNDYNENDKLDFISFDFLSFCPEGIDNELFFCYKLDLIEIEDTGLAQLSNLDSFYIREDSMYAIKLIRR